MPVTKLTKVTKVADAVDDAADLARTVKAAENAADAARWFPDSAPSALQGCSKGSKLRMSLAPDGEVLVDGARISKGANSNIKGNFGETIADSWAKDKGWQKLNGADAEIGDKITKGIDSVYRDPGPPPKFVVADAKFGTAQLGKLKDGTKQMSDAWIDDRLNDAVGKKLANQIRLEGYERAILRVDKFGNVAQKTLK